MAEVINLRMARKAQKRAKDEAEAASKRALFGRTKGERERQEAEALRRERTLDGAKRDPE